MEYLLSKVRQEFEPSVRYAQNCQNWHWHRCRLPILSRGSQVFFTKVQRDTFQHQWVLWKPSRKLIARSQSVSNQLWYDVQVATDTSSWKARSSNAVRCACVGIHRRRCAHGHTQRIVQTSWTCLHCIRYIYTTAKISSVNLDMMQNSWNGSWKRIGWVQNNQSLKTECSHQLWRCVACSGFFSFSANLDNLICRGDRSLIEVTRYRWM